MTPTAPALLALLVSVPVTFAQDTLEPPATLQDALGGGRAWLNFNYRVEHADEADVSKTGLASTLRTALGYETLVYMGFSAMVEFEDVTAIGDEDSYNSTTNGQTDRAFIPDPVGTEINQVSLSYTGLENFALRGGRQEINYGNQRFIGAVGWRQNHQSFDGIRADWNAPSGSTASYSYLGNVNRVFGEDSPKGSEQMNTHLFDFRHPFEGIGSLAAYAYHLDFDRSSAISTTTIGGRFAGKTSLSGEAKLLYAGEYAQQSDAGDNPVDVDADYWLAELGVDVNWMTVRLGNEHLGGSGMTDDKFTTPLATLHKFNGFADVFLVTPDTGLDDSYLTVSGDIGQVSCAATYHVFESDTGGIDYGTEIDFLALYSVTERVKVGGKLASFKSDSGLPDTDRAMAWVSYQLR